MILFRVLHLLNVLFGCLIPVGHSSVSSAYKMLRHRIKCNFLIGKMQT